MDHKEYRLAVIMFTDIVGFSRMMEQDEVGTLKLMDFHNALVRESVATWGGKVIKTIGDAFLSEFSNTGNAVRCGIEIQKKLEDYNAASPEKKLVLRIGVHLGDIYFFENDALGEGINIASRLQSLCRPGRICISQEVYNTVSNKIDTPIKPLGQVALKNISRNIHAYEVMCNGGAEADEPAPQPESHAAGSDGTAGDGTLAAAAAGGAGQAVPSLSETDIKEVRSQVFARIKSAGRRISVDEARSCVGQKGPLVDAYLEELASSGFLVRKTPESAGPARPEPVGRDQDYGRERERDRSGSRDRYHSGPQYGDELGQMARQAGKLVKEFAQGLGEEIRKEIEDGDSRRWDRRKTEEQEFDFLQVVDQQDRALKKEKAGFKSHLVPFAAVNAGLWALWLFTGAGFMWPLIVTLAWGIGVASHAATVSDKEKEQRILVNLPRLKLNQWNILRRLFKNRRGWSGHLVSNVATGVFLFILNLLVSPEFLWCVFPLAGMGIGLFSHLPGYKAKDQELITQLAAEGVPVDVLGNVRNLKEIQDLRIELGSGTLGLEAEQYRKRIVQQLKGLKGRHPLGSDFPRTLDDYVRQIKVLSLRDTEITQVLERIDMQNFEVDYARTKAECEGEQNPRLKVEYEKTLEQMDAQRQAHQDIQGEQKLLQLRLQNAINGLKRLEMDVARMSSLSVTGKSAASAAVGDKSRELQEYMEDLKLGYDEIEKIADYTKIDPFEQLMKKAEADTQNQPVVQEPAANATETRKLEQDSPGV